MIITKFFDRDWQEVPPEVATYASQLTFRGGQLVRSVVFVAEEAPAGGGAQAIGESAPLAGEVLVGPELDSRG